MKKLFCLILCLTALFCCCGCSNLLDEGSGEYKILELTENKIPDDREFSVVDNNGNTVLINQDVDKVMVVFEKSKDRYLELRLTDEGAKKFKSALKQKDTVLTITIDGEKLASPVIADDAEDKSAIVLGEYKEVMSWFNKIT